MEFLRQAIDFILHIDKHLFEWAAEYHSWIYLLLAAIVFCETGIIFMAFLPGDALLFAAGTLIAALKDDLNIFLCGIILVIAANLGNILNYKIGDTIGKRVFSKDYKLINKKYLEKTKNFYDKYGTKTIVLARFVPIVRTFAPFIAGAVAMNYRHYLTYSIIGSILWVSIFLTVGYLFGNIPIIKQNLSLVMIGMIAVSGIPVLIGLLRKDKTENNTTA